MKTLPEPEAGPLMEHPVVCQSCRERLDTEMEFVTAMRLLQQRSAERTFSGRPTGEEEHALPIVRDVPVETRLVFSLRSSVAVRRT
jgi:hypothetical protein